MEIIQAYCGKMIVLFKGVYAVIDTYSEDILFKGTLQECEKEFDKYVQKIINR